MTNSVRTHHDNFHSLPSSVPVIMVYSGPVLLNFLQHVGESHWTVQLFIQANQKTGPSTFDKR